MPSIKRLVARERIRERNAEKKKLTKLTLQRNKAVREAERAVKQATLLEQKRKAEARREQITGRVPLSKQLRQQGERGAKAFGVTLLRAINNLNAPAPKRKRKTTKTTTKRRR